MTATTVRTSTQPTAPETKPRGAASRTALRAVLVVLGVASMFVAVNVAFGGLETLGLQGPTKYFDVTDQHAFQIRDSHTRYYGGVYLALGAFLVLAATDVRRFRIGLNVVFALIFVGGLSRLTQLEPGVMFGSELMVSSIIELVGIPVLALWVANATRAPAPTSPAPALATTA